MKLRVIDPYLLQGHRADMGDADRQNLSLVLRLLAKCVRGSHQGEVESYKLLRPYVANYLYNLTRSNFLHGQHDPIDLFETLLRVYNVGGVFTTKKTIQSQYNNGSKATSVTVDQMFRYSVTHAASSCSSSTIKFEALFPCIETLVLDNKEGDELAKQRTIVEFGGGPVLVLTRETFHKPVHYGRWSSSTNAYLLPILNTVEKSLQWYELQSVLCWKGHMAAAGEVGHYVCFVYDDTKWYFYNDMFQKAQGFAGLDEVLQPETHPEYPPSETGSMFIYAKVPSPPKDI